MQKHFVVFMSPGTVVSENTEEEIDSWDVNKAKQMAKEIVERYNSKPYGFYFKTMGRTENELTSHQIARSGKYFINAKLESYDEIKAKNDPENKILLSNMRINGWTHVVTTYSPWEWTQPYINGDCLVWINYDEE